MITIAAAPENSKVSASLADAYFHDTYEAMIEGTEKSIMEIYLRAVANTPSWIQMLMRLRNRIVSMVGLKDLGGMGDIDPHKPADSYRVGDRVAIFSILSLTENELVLGDSDKHLRAQVSLYKYQGSPGKVAVTTVVHVHNFLGRAYLFFVVPVHKRIVPAMLRRMVV